MKIFVVHHACRQPPWEIQKVRVCYCERLGGAVACAGQSPWRKRVWESRGLGLSPKSQEGTQVEGNSPRTTSSVA